MKFEKLSNTRDLGGIRTLDGRYIKHAKLIRSGQLYFASDSDMKKLREYNVRRIIDFRTTKEKDEKPDSVPEGCSYAHLPIFDEQKHGITREESGKSAFSELMEGVSEGSGGAAQYMTRTYRDFATDEFALAQYSRFLGMLLENREGAVLWHCTAGKDRAGFATVLVLEILGVDREVIISDYLSTNEYLREEINGIMLALGPLFREKKKMLSDIFSARREYLQSVYDEISLRCGSFDSFLETKLGIGNEVRERFRKKYLG